MNAPLTGLVILEQPGGVATRYCGKLFAAHGATVLQSGAPRRRRQPRRAGQRDLRPRRRVLERQDLADQDAPGAIRPPMPVIDGSVTFNFGSESVDVYRQPDRMKQARWRHLSYIMQGSMNVLNPDPEQASAVIRALQ